MARVYLRVYLQEIDDLIENGRIEEAIAHCRYLLELYPKYIEVYRLLGKAYLETQRYSDANDVLQRVLSSIPDDFISHLGMSIIREDEGNLDAAIWHMERAFEVQPSNAALQEELRRLYGRRDGMEPTKIHLTRGALARMYAKGDLYDQAIAEIRATLAEDPTRFDLQHLLARMYAQNGQDVEAVKTCSNLLHKHPYSKEAILILLDVLPDSDRLDETKNYHKRLQELDPYSAHTSPSALVPDQVPDKAITLERLEWVPELGSVTSESAPDWASSLGVTIDSKDQEEKSLPDWLVGPTQEVPDNETDLLTSESPMSDEIGNDIPPSVTSDDDITSISDISPTNVDQPESDVQIPDWMQSAGWQVGAGDSDESKERIPHEDEIGISEEELLPADIPVWLESLAPSTDSDIDGEPEHIEEFPEIETVTWLDEKQPGATDSIVTWLQTKEYLEEEQDSSYDTEGKKEFKDPEQPFKANEIPEDLVETPSQATSDVEHLEESDEHPLTKDIHIAREYINDEEETPEVPGWLVGIGVASTVKKILDTSDDFDISDDQENSKIETNEDIPVWMHDDIDHTATTASTDDISSEIGEEIMNEENKIPNMSADDDNETLAWLESLAAKQGAEDEELLTSPDERPSAPPEWVQQLAAEREPDERVGTLDEIESITPLETEFQSDEFEEHFIDDTKTSPALEPAEKSEGIPDWLQDLIDVSSSEEDVSMGDLSPDEISSIEDDVELVEEQIPDWLRDLAEEPASGRLTPIEKEPAVIKGDTHPTFLGEKEFDREDESEVEAVDIPADGISGVSAAIIAETGDDNVEMPEWMRIDEEIDLSELSEPVTESQPEHVEEQQEVLEWTIDDSDEDTVEILKPDFTSKVDDTEKELEIPEWITDDADESSEYVAEEQPSEIEIDLGELEVHEWTTEEDTVESIELLADEQLNKAEIADEELEIPEWMIEKSIEEKAESLEEQQLGEADSAEKPEVPEISQPSSSGIDEPFEAIEEALIIEDLTKIPEEELLDQSDEVLSAKVELNKSSFKSLERLPGIGPVIAQSIIDYREIHGPFQDVESLLDVPGIGPKTLEIFKNLVYIESIKEIESMPGSYEMDQLAEARQALENGDLSLAFDRFSELIEEEQLLHEVIKDLEEVQYRYPVEVSIYELLGDAYLRNNQIQAAIDMFTKAEELLT